MSIAPETRARLEQQLLADADALAAADALDRYGVQLAGEDVVRLVALLREAAAYLQDCTETASIVEPPQAQEPNGRT